MASSAPSKSQPLHNFELPPLLKWSKDGKSSGSQKRRRSLMSPPQRSSAASGSPIHRDYASPRDRSPESPVKHTSVCDGIQHLAIGGDWSTEAEASRKGKELGKKSNASAIRKCNLQIKIGSNKEEGEIENAGKDNQKADDEARPWNLRPRNAKTKIEYGGGEKSLRRGGKEGKGEEREKGEKKKNKMTINIALTKEEIEEDIFAMTGAKPSRRPQRRPKNVQKQLDLTFPGLHLRSITPDSY